ncbi:hypothetical protein FOZ60_000140, partial [Perkinsus olseni]
VMTVLVHAGGPSDPEEEPDVDMGADEEDERASQQLLPRSPDVSPGEASSPLIDLIAGKNRAEGRVEEEVVRGADVLVCCKEPPAAQQSGDGLDGTVRCGTQRGCADEDEASEAKGIGSFSA